MHTSQYSRLENRRYRLPPKNDYHVFFGISTYHHAYARQTPVKSKKETKKRKEGEGKERKDKIAKKRKRKREGAPGWGEKRANGGSSTNGENGGRFSGNGGRFSGNGGGRSIIAAV